MPRGNFLKPEELEYIRQNCLAKTDEEMAEYLKRDVRTIASARKKLGIKKTRGGKVENYETKTSNKNIVLQASQRLTEDQRKEFFKTQLTNSLYYQNLKDQFTKEEIDFYLEEWSSLCVQFEDIVATEKRQIDELIKAEIMGNRILRNVKITEEQITLLQEEVDLLRKTHEMEDDEAAQERDIQLMNMIRTFAAQSQVMSNDYQKNVALKNNLLNELNARRRDRVDQITKRGTTFLGLVESFREREMRENQGRHTELVRMAKEKKRSEWRKPTTFADATQDCVLMDEYSIIPEKEIVRIEDYNPKLVDRFSKEKNKKILVIDDEIERCIFFQGKFINNKIDFASNLEKAIDKLNNNEYDLICMDYDLGLTDKGSQVAEYLVNEKKSPKAPIIVHSMNPKGAEIIKDILSKANKSIEVKRFIDIRDNVEN
jgi:CheY-like chemotaxis protein